MCFVLALALPLLGALIALTWRRYSSFIIEQQQARRRQQEQEQQEHQGQEQQKHEHGQPGKKVQ